MEYKFLTFGLLGICALIFWSIELGGFFKKGQLILPAGSVVKKMQTGKMAVFLIGLIGWSLVTLALTGPREALKYLPSNIEVNDIFMVVDVSRSMLAEDIEPNRLEVAKKKLREFASLRPTDRIGIIMFSERVFTLLPLTTDPDIITKVIEDIQIGFLGSGTNIGDGLALAVARAKGSETKNKVVILLTDGVNNVGNVTPMKAAQLAKDEGMKVYSITLGTNQDAKIPVGRGFFGTQYQTIPGGSFDLETMNKISELTGGKSYLADSEGSLEEILNEIQQLEKTEIKANNQVVYEEKYWPYLVSGILFLLISELVRRFIVKEVA